MTTNTTELLSSNVTTFPSQCLVLQPRDFIPWNNSENIISFETEQAFKKMKELVFLPVTFLIGVPANVINMAVFYLHGLKERINVCLFALSLADGLFLVAHMVSFGEQIYLHFTSHEQYGPVFQWIANHYLLGFFAFKWVSQVLSAIVACERCFCVLQPLRSQTILTTSTMKVIIVVAFVVVMVPQFLVVTRYHIVCAYDSVTGRVTMTAVGGEFYYRHQKLVDFLDIFVYGVAIPWLAIAVVTATTIITVIKLRRVAEWRAGVASSGGGGCGGGGGGGVGGGGGGGVSARDVALTRMLVGNSVFFIVCVIPVILFRFFLLFMPEINAGRRHHNLFAVGLWLLNIFSYINATFNIVIYYTMGSRYRCTVRTLLGRRTTKKDNPSKALAAAEMTSKATR